MSGMGTSTSFRPSSETPWALRVERTATSLMPRRVLTAIFLPARSATVLIFGSSVSNWPEPSCSSLSDARAPTETIRTGTPLLLAISRLTRLEYPNWKSPLTTAGTMAAPPCEFWVVTWRPCLAKKPFLMPSCTGAMSMMGMTPSLILTGPEPSSPLPLPLPFDPQAVTAVRARVATAA